MTRKIIRNAQIFFNRMQSSSARTLQEGLKNDELWMSLSGKEHQKIGKTIAKYPTYFAMNCPILVKVNYSYTDNNGNGIYG